MQTIQSGESGTGKTETLKLTLKFLRANTDVDDQEFDKLNEALHHSHHLLESFGNAKVKSCDYIYSRPSHTRTHTHAQ